jgi:hypothetical protein
MLRRMAEGEPLDQRVPVMMSKAEVDAIDTWRFANRVASRAQAIRLMCKEFLAAQSKPRTRKAG